MQRHLPALAELPVADDKRAAGEVDIAAFEIERFPEAHARHRHQADERFVGRRGHR